VRELSPVIARRLPVENWPAWLGRIHEVKVPRAVIPQGVPAPTGGANINILLHMVARTQELEGILLNVECFEEQVRLRWHST
jgi:hypothetical protein